MSVMFTTMTIPGFKPDIVIPEFKVIIDPYSPFHHSLEDAQERDVEKMVLYESIGYRYYHPWAVEPGVFTLDQAGVRHVKGSAMEILAQIREFTQPPQPLIDERDRAAYQVGYRIGEFLGAGATSVAAANRARRRPKAREVKRGTRRGKK